MASVTSCTIPGVIDGQVTAYNENATRLAVSSDDRIQILTRTDDLHLWQLSGGWQSAGSSRMTEIAWAPNEHGRVLACASEDGIIGIWQQQQQSEDGQTGIWIQIASLQESITQITSIHFAPKQLGLQLAAASKDGFVRFYQANRPVNADRWQLSNDLQATTSGACTCLSWRQHTYGLPSMLCVGTSQEAQIWFYRPTLGDWFRTAKLDTRGAPVSAIHWAPTLGRPMELISAACGRQVLIWSLRGKAHSLQIEQMACLEVDEEAWKVKFAKFGNLLAASTAGNGSSCVYVWELRPTESKPAGSWELQSTISGNAAVTSGEQAMLEG